MFDHKSSSYETSKLLEGEDTPKAEKSVSERLEETIRKSGDGESASTTHDTTQDFSEDKEDNEEYHNQWTGQNIDFYIWADDLSETTLQLKVLKGRFSQQVSVNHRS